MNEAEKLKKIIEIAVERGFSYELVPEGIWVKTVLDSPMAEVFLIFSHPFLKAYFGEEKVSRLSGSNELGYEETRLIALGLMAGERVLVPAWQYHAQQLVLAEDRIEYLWKHRPKEEK